MSSHSVLATTLGTRAVIAVPRERLSYVPKGARLVLELGRGVPAFEPLHPAPRRAEVWAARFDESHPQVGLSPSLLPCRYPDA